MSHTRGEEFIQQAPDISKIMSNGKRNYSTATSLHSVQVGRMLHVWFLAEKKAHEEVGVAYLSWERGKNFIILKKLLFQRCCRTLQRMLRPGREALFFFHLKGSVSITAFHYVQFILHTPFSSLKIPTFDRRRCQCWHPTLTLNSPKPETPMYSLVIHAQADTCETCRGMHEILFVFTHFFVKLLVYSYFTEKHEKRWCSSDRITFSFSIKGSVWITVFHCVQLLPHTPFSMIYSFSCWVERPSTHVMSQCCLLRSADAWSMNCNRRMNEWIFLI